MADDGIRGDRRAFLVGYEHASPGNGIRVRLAGKLSSEGAKLLKACRAHVCAMPVSRIRFDLSALQAIDEAGARSLIAMCSSLRRDGFEVDVHGLRAEVGAALAERTLATRAGRQRPHGPPASTADRGPGMVPGVDQPPAG